jgi:hypothetical protein
MKPTKSTPIDAVILIIAALATWLDQHKAALDLYLPESLDEADEVRAGGYALEIASNHYIREVREDVAQTAAREGAIEEGHVVLRATINTASRRFTAAQVHERAIKDFGTVRPSRLLYIPTVRKALRTARQATLSHAATLDSDGKPRSAHLIQRLDEIIDKLDKVSEDEVRETQETRTARRTFELAHERAMEIIDELHAAAESALLDTRAPLDALATLYEEANHRAAAKRAPSEPAPDPSGAPS